MIASNRLVMDSDATADVKLERLALSLQCTVISSQLLFAATLLPLAVCIYNVFVSPTLAHIQQAEGQNIRAVLCQMLMTGAMLYVLRDCNSSSPI